jgi:hypothetical protein
MSLAAPTRGFGPVKIRATDSLWQKTRRYQRRRFGTGRRLLARSPSPGREKRINHDNPSFHQNGTTGPGAHYSAIVLGGFSPVKKMLAVLSRFVQRPQPPTPPAAPFDDGLTEIARLLELEEPDRDDMKPTARAPARRA